MTQEELQRYLAAHPDVKTCPLCGGAGTRLFGGSGKEIECEWCKGAGVVPKVVPDP